jgi:hypothetical protein
MSLTRHGDIKLSAALADAEAVAANGTENVGQDSNVVLANTLVLVDLVAARHLGFVSTLVDGILHLVVRDVAVGGWQGHGSGSEENSGDEKLHFERFVW